MLCKHIVCPYEAIKYKCCSNFYKQDIQNRAIVCDFKQQMFEYDELWWMGPIVVSLVIFVYLPLLIMNISARASFTKGMTSHLTDRQAYQTLGQASEFVFYDGTFHITLFGTLFSPILKSVPNFQLQFSRGIRFMLPWLSLSIIGLQILLDYKFIYSFVLDSVVAKAPMGFRSMLAGYHASTKNFLPFLGGPFVALMLYLVITCTSIVLPRSLCSHLESGLPDGNSKPAISPLMLSLRQKEQFGSVNIQSEYGYKKIYNVWLAQFYMLLNKKYWRYAVGIQFQRFGTPNKTVSFCVWFPLHFLVCVFEHIVCVLYYGLPISSFALIIASSYYRSILRIKEERMLGRISTACVAMLLVFLLVCLLVFLFMFCTIFLDACLFLARLFIFTYTGIVVYPKASYGYLIFTLTIVYYLWVCVKDFSLTYNKILKTTIKVCRKLQRANDRERNVVKVGMIYGVRESILDHVIEQLCPRRKTAFLSLLKLCIILGAIGVSLDLLIKTDSFRELHILVHVSTALFTCAVPRIAKVMFGRVEGLFEQRVFEDKVKRAVRQLLSVDNTSMQEYDESDIEEV